MSALQAMGSAACPAEFTGPSATFTKAFNSTLAADDEDAASKTEAAVTLVQLQKDFETAKAETIASDGAKALETFAGDCPDANTKVCTLRYALCGT
jgi:hypothetical protein